MNYKNQLVLTGALDDVGAPIRATSGNSYRLGLEIDADITLSDQFSIKPNAAFSSNKNKDFLLQEMELILRKFRKYRLVFFS